MLVQIAKNMKFSKVIETSSVNEAIKEAKNLISPSVTTIVVGGSLFVAAAVRSIIKDIRDYFHIVYANKPQKKEYIDGTI